MEIEAGEVSAMPAGSAPSETAGTAVELISAAVRKTVKLVFAYTFAGTGDEQSARTAGPVAGRVYGSDTIGGKKLFVTVKVSEPDFGMAAAGRETSI